MRSRLILFTLAVACEFAPRVSVAQLTLDSAVAMAVANNPSLQVAKQQIEAASGQSVQARLWSNLELEFSSEEFPPRGGGFGSAQNLLGVSQTVPFPGKKSLDARIGRRGVTAAEQEYRTREIELVRETKKAFYLTLSAERKGDVLSEIVELAQSLAEAAGKRVEAGDASDQERLRAEIELERATTELRAIQRELSEAQSQLATLMGQPRVPVGLLASELSDTSRVPDLAQTREQMLERHPIVQAMKAKRDRADLELRRARLEPMPDITFGFAGGRDNGESRSLLAFRLSLPFPLIDRSQGRKREARALAQVAQFDLAGTEQQLIQELDVVAARLSAAADQVEAYRDRILPKAEDAFGLVRGGFDAGKFGFIDLVDTQRLVAEVRLNYYDKLYELNAAQAELEALIGTRALGN